MNEPRWNTVIRYRSQDGTVDVPHDIEELDELQALVERGPDWNTIDKIEITLARTTSPNLTIEAAEKQ